MMQMSEMKVDTFAPNIFVDNEKDIMQKQSVFTSQTVKQQYNLDDSTDQESNSQNQSEIQVYQAPKPIKSTVMQAYMNLFKGYIGSGILALPYSFNQTGWLLGTVIFLMIAFIVNETMQILFKLADSFQKEGISYSFLAKHHFGRKGVLSVRFFLVIFQIGCCISYVIFFIKFLESVFDMVGTSKQNDLIYLLVALLIIIPMSFINDIASFAKISTIANAMITVTLIAIIIHIKGLSNLEYSENVSNRVQFKGIPMMIGVSIYSFESIGLIFSIRNSMERPKEQFGQVFRNINGLMVCLYISFSVIATIAYGDSINEILLLNLPRRVDVQILQIMYAFALIMSYPLQLLPSFQIIEKTSRIYKFINYYNPRLNQNQGRSLEDPSPNNSTDGQENNSISTSSNIAGLHKSILTVKQSVVLRRVLIRVIISLMISFSAYAIPRFAIFLNIVGAVAGTSLQFVYPIVMYCQTFKHSITKLKRVQLYTYVVVGMLGGLFSFIFSLIEVFNSRTPQDMSK